MLPMRVTQVIVADVQMDQANKTDPGYTEPKKELIANLKHSLKRDGLIHPISVVSLPEKPGKYLVVTGRKRLLAARELGWDCVDAVILPDDIAQKMIRSRFLAENLWRSQADKGSFLLATQEWFRLYMEEEAGIPPAPPAPANPSPSSPPAKPETKPRRRAAPETIEAEAKFREKLQDSTGLKSTQARQMLAVVKALDPASITALTAANTSQADMYKIARVNNADARAKIVALVAANMPVDEAFAEAERLVDSQDDEGHDFPAATGPVSDLDYAKKYCGAIHRKLDDRQNANPFLASLSIYRRIVDERAEFARKHSRPLAEAALVDGVGQGGAFTRLVSQFCRITHPRDWLLCSRCAGAGRADNGAGEARCEACKGDGFRLNFDRMPS